MSRAPIMPNAENCSLEELETAAKCAPNLKAFQRLSAMRVLLQSFSHKQVAMIYCVTKRTLRNWILRFNEAGIDGLIAKKQSGRPRKIPKDKTAALRCVIENPQEAGQTHWTARKFHGYLRTSLDCEIGYSTTVRWLHEQNFRLKVPQPWPDRQDETLRKEFIERLGTWLEDENIELWYLDETGIEADPRPRRRWAVKGSKPRVTRNGEHIRMNVTGMVCPRTGEFYALEFTHSDSEVFQVFLDHANGDVCRERQRNLLIMDNASWHKRKTTRWGNFEPVYLPPYSPDLNPIERLWLILKAEWFTDYIAKSREELCQRLDMALKWAIDRKTENQNTCTIRK